MIKQKKLLLMMAVIFFRSVNETKNIIDRSNKQFVSVIGPNDINHAGWFDHEWYYVAVQNKM
jgi:hypothetical protein